jgi:UPF0755 protein
LPYFQALQYVSVVRKSFFLKILIVPAFLALYVFWGFVAYFQAPGPSPKNDFFMIEAGESLSTISRRLYDAGLISSEKLFRWGILLSGKSRNFRAGDYFIAAHESPYDLAQLVMSTQAQHKKITVPEGLTNHQVLNLLKEKPFLKVDAVSMPVEGMLYPETYIFAKGTKLSRVVGEMAKNMEKTLETLWAQRVAGLPLNSPMEALILASIVEKEATFDSEKPTIAGVYLNRLKQNMPLQADPTIIYGLSNGTGDLGRMLVRSDMLQPGRFNTYKNKGLPPTPIASPSLASLKAVLLYPEATDALYFVADGKGGHRFSKHYHVHKNNIEKLRECRRKPEVLTANTSLLSPLPSSRGPEQPVQD